MTVVDPYPLDITPSVADVAALLRARTKDVNGVEVGTFNDDTRPTSSQTITLIDEAVADIQARMGLSPPPELAGAGRSATAMLTGVHDRAQLLPRAGAVQPQRVRALASGVAIMYYI